MDLKPSKTVKALLDPDAILEREFEYARDASLQANSDRAQIVNLYLLLVGGVGSILLAVPTLAGGRGLALPTTVYAAGFLMLGVLGLFTIFKLIRLRQAWHDSVRAMNRVKDFYIVHYPALAPAFLWRTESIPAPDKLGTITFNLAMLVALTDSLAAGAGVYFLPLLQPALWAGGAALAFFAFQTWIYFWLLRRGG
jgi:hypothetical protein